MDVIYKDTAPTALDSVLRMIDLGRDEGGRDAILGTKLTLTGRKAGNRVQIVNRDRQHFCCRLTCLASSSTKRIFKLLIVCGIALLCGCSHEHYVQGSGDAGQFILQRALVYGGHPIATNGLATVGGDWRYVQDEFGVAVLFPASQFSAVDAYLRSAFGPPSSQAGWSVRDVGVAVYLQRVDTNTEVGIFPPMSDEQQARMWQKLADMVKKNTR